MFGMNPIRPIEILQDGQTLAVQEVFYTLQGEGPYSGRPAVFIRLAGCNLACTFCDTEFESNINQRLAVREIVAQVMAAPIRDFVVLTGGEPLRQNIIPLVKDLLSNGVKLVQIETAGTLWVTGMEELLYACSVEMVVSPKTPGLSPRVTQWARHYKYIIEAGRTSPDDGLPQYGTQQANTSLKQKLFRPTIEYVMSHFISLGLPAPTIWVSPCDMHDADPEDSNAGAAMFGVQTQANIAEAVRVALKYGYRLSLQTHKIVNLP